MNIKLLSTIILTTSLFTGCGSSGGDDTPITTETPIQTEIIETTPTQATTRHFKGKLSEEFTNPTVQTKSLRDVKLRDISDIGDISEILAFAIKDGKVDLSLTKSVPVEEDGSFDLEFDGSDDNDTDWVMMMSNPDARTPEERLGNFVSLSEGDVGLTSIPMGTALEDIDVGELTKKDDETTSSNSIRDVAPSFSQDTTNLLARAGLDSSAKGAKNDYINYDSVSGIYWNSWLNYRYYDIDAYNKFSDINTYKDYYGGWAMEIITNKYSVSDMPELCNGDYNINFIPPAEVINAYNDEIHSPTNPYDDKDLTFVDEGSMVYCGKDDRFGFISDNTHKDVHLGVHTFEGDVPQGYWKVTSNDEVLSIFDLAVGSIFDKDDNFQILVPSAKFTVDANYKITKINLKWYMYNYTTKAYEEVLDDTLIKKFVKACYIRITDHDGIDGNENRMDDFVNPFNSYEEGYSSEITEFNQDWYVTGNKDNSKMTVDNVMLTVEASKYLQVYFNYKF